VLSIGANTCALRACLLAIPRPIELELPSLGDHYFEDTDSTWHSDRAAKIMTRIRQDKRKTGMNSSSAVEFRRAAHSLDGDDRPAAQQAEALVQRENFSLDSDWDANKPPSGSLLSLTSKDKRSFFLLVLLYFLQGVPMGLAMGSVPYLLKSKLSYGEIGVFTLATYPYSMKLLWSPIVDAIWSPKMGRRKSWIVPIQTFSALMLLWLGGRAERLMEEASQHLYYITFVFFALVMLCATQDIAVDGMFNRLWTLSDC
jgi:PAT family acetyl-CoA transporter-like MFS transporter 1